MGLTQIRQLSKSILKLSLLGNKQQQQYPRSVYTRFTTLKQHRFTTINRFFTSDGGGNKPTDDKDKKDNDPFGLDFDDGLDGLGPKQPPLYKRDATTGRFTGEIQQEITDQEKRVLEADPIERDRMVQKSLEKHWTKQDTDESGLNAEVDKLGGRIREANMSLNVLGRSVKAQGSAEELDDGTELGRDETGFSQHLTKNEFRNFSDYMKEKHYVEISEEDIPVQENKSRRTRMSDNELDDDPDSRELALKWLTSRAQREMDDTLDDNPYSDLTPGDLSPTRLVNRKRAKRIPARLLHHNNLGLLQHFISPTGQIKNRIQTRLGARDQRRVAKLIKRARAMGLVPYIGQFKTEQHGWVNSSDIEKNRTWERKLVERGLFIKSKDSRNNEES